MVSMSLFRLRSFLVTPAILLKQSISNALSFLCAFAMTVQVSAVETRSTRDSYSLTLVVIVISVDDHIVCSFLISSTAAVRRLIVDDRIGRLGVRNRPVGIT